MMGPRRGLRYERNRPSKRMTILVISGPLSKPKGELFERVVRHLAPKYLATLKIGDGDVASAPSGADDQSWEVCPCCASEESLLSTIYTIRSTINPDVLLVDLNAEGSLATVHKRLKSLPNIDFNILPSVLVTNTTELQNLGSSYNEPNEVLLGAIFHFFDANEQSPQSLATYKSGSPIIFEDVDGFADILDQWQMALDNRDTKADAGDLQSEAEDYFLLESPHCDCLADLVEFARLTLRYRFGRVTMFQGIIRYGDQLALLDICDGQFRITGAGATQNATAVMRGVEVDIEGLAANLRTAYRPTLRSTYEINHKLLRRDRA